MAVPRFPRHRLGGMWLLVGKSEREGLVSPQMALVETACTAHTQSGNFAKTMTRWPGLL
jgi:hypothetical protein